MSLPEGFTIRPVDPDADLRAVSALFEACDIADVGEPDLPVDWLVETWRGASLRGAWLVERDGEVVAYAELVSTRPETAIDSFLPVHPAHRAGPLRATLLSFLDDRARELAAGPDVTLRLSLSAADVVALADAQRAGFEHVRTFWHMERALGPDEDPGIPPPGVTVRPSIDPDDDEVVHRVLEDAFRGHFGMEPMTLEEWRADFKDGMYDPSLILLAEVDGEAVGVASNWLPDGVGWVGDLAVLDGFRGRGIGRALLRRSFATLAAHGASTARLNVDGDNESGATRLYASVGMRERRRWPIMEKRLRREG